MDCRPRVAPGRGRGIGPWKIRRGLASPGPGRERETQTSSRARTETATPSDRGTEPGTGARRDTGASGGTGTGGGAATPARTDTGSGTRALPNKGFGRNPAQTGRGTEPGGRAGTRPRPPGRRPGKPRSRRPTGRRISGAADPRGEAGGGGPAAAAPMKPRSQVPALLRRPWPLVLGSRLKGRQCRSSLLRS